MFEFFFKYPASVFRRGDFVLLGAWPVWAMYALLLALAAALAWMMWSRLPKAAANLHNWRAGLIWALQTALVALVLVLLWQPAIMIAELKTQQNIIAVLVDDSKSMGISENGSTREAQAVKALQGGVLDALQQKFQTRLYRLDDQLSHVSKLDELQPTGAATRVADSLKQLADETTDLPIGAVVLLSDGSDNSGGIDLDTISMLRNRHIPVHTVGFGEERASHDVEIDDAIVAPRALANSRLSARVSFHQRGYSGSKANLTVRDGDKVLEARKVTLGSDGQVQTENLVFNVGAAGTKSLQFSVDPLPGEENRANNAIARLVNVTADKRRILYVEGEPRWEYKFIRRAEDDDQNVQLTTMLRTTENKIYRQGVDDPKELADGFPANVDDLFKYQGLIVGSVDANYFTPAQQDLIKQFVDRRGGGLLLLGGRFALSDGGWQASTMADLLPVVLPNRKGTFHQDPATVSLAPAGRDSIICRLVEDPQQNEDRWKKLPYLMDYQEAGTPKPGAAVLAEMTAAGRTMPMLTTETYGRGRSAVLATGGTWRWQMTQPAGDPTHTEFWQQLLRWLVADTPGRLVSSVPNQMLFDDGHVKISADVRDKDYQPMSDAQVTANITGPDGASGSIELRPDPNTPGVLFRRMERRKAGIVYRGRAGDARQRTGGDGRAELRANRRRGGKFPHATEPRPARTAVFRDGRPLLAAAAARRAGE